MAARMIKAFCADESAATAIEYGLLAAMIAVAAIASFMVFGDSLENLMGRGAGSAAEVIAAQEVH